MSSRAATEDPQSKTFLEINLPGFANEVGISTSSCVVPGNLFYLDVVQWLVDVNFSTVQSVQVKMALVPEIPEQSQKVQESRRVDGPTTL